MNSLLALAWRNLRADRTRTILSIIAVSFGVSATIASNIIARSLGALVLKSEDMRTIMEGLLSQADPLMGVISIFVMLAAGFLIFNGFAMSITRRRQEIGGLRAIGMTRQQILRLMLAEALIIGLVGTIIGLILAPLIGLAMTSGIQAISNGLVAFQYTPPAAWSIILAVVLGIGVTLFSNLVPARAAARITPLEALREPEASAIDTLPVARTVIGFGMMLVLLLYIIIAPPADWVQFPVDANLTALFVILWVLAIGLILPVLTYGAARLIQRLQTNTTGRLISDNIQRGRNRVALTMFSILFSLAVIIGLSGFTNFFISELMMGSADGAVEQDVMFISHLDPTAGIEAMSRIDFDNVLLPPAEVAAIEAAVGNLAHISPNYFIVSPELSFLGNAYFTYVLDMDETDIIQSMFTFTEGDWDTARAMTTGRCGVLIPPLVARKNNVSYGDTLTATVASGNQAECIVAGIGSGMTGTSIINVAGGEALGITNPVMLLVMPRLGISTADIDSALEIYFAEYPDSAVATVELMMIRIQETTDVLNFSFTAMLLLAVLAAAMSVINTILISIDERRREIGLLRAVGATRKQVRAVIVGEAALIGIVGGMAGVLAGVGVVLIIVLTYGGNSFGLDLAIRSVAVGQIQAILYLVVAGTLLAPLVSALAAWLPARRILRENPVETLALR